MNEDNKLEQSEESGINSILKELEEEESKLSSSIKDPQDLLETIKDESPSLYDDLKSRILKEAEEEILKKHGASVQELESFKILTQKLLEQEDIPEYFLLDEDGNPFPAETQEKLKAEFKLFKKLQKDYEEKVNQNSVPAQEDSYFPDAVDELANEMKAFTNRLLQASNMQGKYEDFIIGGLAHVFLSDETNSRIYAEAASLRAKGEKAKALQKEKELKKNFVKFYTNAEVANLLSILGGTPIKREENRTEVTTPVGVAVKSEGATRQERIKNLLRSNKI